MAQGHKDLGVRFSHQMRDAMEELGITQKVLSDHTGIALATINRMYNFANEYSKQPKGASFWLSSWQTVFDALGIEVGFRTRPLKPLDREPYTKR